MDQENGLGMGKDIPPWLQPVPDNEENGAQVTSNKLLLATIAGAVVIISLFVALIMYLYDNSVTQEPIHVAAPEKAIKEKPTDPGGMRVDHRDKAIFDQSDGVKPRGEATLGAQPEVPLKEIPEDPVGDTIAELTPSVDDSETKIVSETTPTGSNVAENTNTAQPKPTVTKPKPIEATPVETENPVSTSGPVFRVQLGAYGNEAAAARAWRSVRGRFLEQLRDKTADYEAVQAGDRTLFRLRVGPYADRVTADQVCLALRAGEQACIVVNP